MAFLIVMILVYLNIFQTYIKVGTRKKEKYAHTFAVICLTARFSICFIVVLFHSESFGKYEYIYMVMFFIL